MIRTVWAWLLFTWGGLHRYFGNLNSMRREHEAAVRYFSRAYAVDPTFYQARLARAVLLWRELGRLDEAQADLDAILAVAPAYAPALLNRAMVAQEDGRFQDAQTDLEAYLRLPDADYQDEAQRLLAALRDINAPD
ncbi:MAG: tetratricopeptide repeat protein [Anaerolineales bacterium]|nr:tetratricopeptide repeat protein [Anaerolineales bacterium]